MNHELRNWLIGFATLMIVVAVLTGCAFAREWWLARKEVRK